MHEKVKILQAVSQEAPTMQISERGANILRPNPVTRGLQTMRKQSPDIQFFHVQSNSDLCLVLVNRSKE